MTILEVQAAATALAEQLTTLIATFEQTTGCTVHSLPVYPADGSKPLHVEVKVQISA